MKAKFRYLYPMVLAFWFLSLPLQMLSVSASELDKDSILQYQVNPVTTIYDFENDSLAIGERNELLRGWQTIEGDTYYFESGKALTGFQEVDGKTYYFDENGILQTGTINVDGQSYALNDEGELQTGWVSGVYGEKYYSEYGTAIKNRRVEIDGKLYTFTKNGFKVVNREVDGYAYDENGIGTRIPTRYDLIAEAALAQLGVMQDCTRLVSNSLKAVGIDFHGAPHTYLSLGEVTNDPVPGDIIVYQGHVAIYIGEGMAVHGGWAGGTTAVYTVECSAPFVAFVHPTLPE